jgi:hypothetical protein
LTAADYTGTNQPPDATYSYAYGYDILDRLVTETCSHIPGGVTLTTSYGSWVGV